jgi:SNF2 family DNA or RNA helicase
MLQRSNLHPYQLTTIDHIHVNPFAGVFLDMGLGKTVSSLTAGIELICNFDVNAFLVIAPKRVAETVWAEECENWAHLQGVKCVKVIGTPAQRIAALAKPADFYLMGRDNVVWLAEVLAKAKKRPPFDALIIDELSSFKNHQSKRFKKLRSMRPLFNRVIGLTGTPAPNGYIDLWAQLFLLDAGERLGKTITGYRKQYFHPGATNGHIVYNYVLNKGADEAIQSKIDDICISMKAKDYLNLPKRFENFIKVRLDAADLAKYKEFEKESVLELIRGEEDDTKSIESIIASNAAVLTGKLLQYANGAIYTEDGDIMEIHDAKLKELEDIIDNANGNPVLIAYNFKHDKERICKQLSKYKPRDIKEEGVQAKWNKGEIPVMLAHPASAGHGLNIQKGGHIMVWFGLTWSLELYQQFNARLDRQGQTKPPIIHHLIATGTVDERVIKVLQGKDASQNGLMEALKDLTKEYIDSFKV